MVNNHGDRKSPNPGVVGPLPFMAFLWLINGGYTLKLFYLVATQIFLEFSPRTLGKMFTHFDEHIFQRGWFNHQLVFTEWGPMSSIAHCNISPRSTRMLRAAMSGTYPVKLVEKRVMNVMKRMKRASFCLLNLLV